MTTDKELTDLTNRASSITGTRFCYKCAAHRPLLGGKIVRLQTGRRAFVCAKHRGPRGEQLS